MDWCWLSNQYEWLVVLLLGVAQVFLPLSHFAVLEMSDRLSAVKIFRCLFQTRTFTCSSLSMVCLRDPRNTSFSKFDLFKDVKYSVKLLRWSTIQLVSFLEEARIIPVWLNLYAHGFVWLTNIFYSIKDLSVCQTVPERYEKRRTANCLFVSPNVKRLENLNRWIDLDAVFFIWKLTWLKWFLAVNYEVLFRRLMIIRSFRRLLMMSNLKLLASVFPCTRFTI